MIVIDLDMPDRCEVCPCVHIADGVDCMPEDHCQINLKHLELKQIEEQRPEWCPLKETEMEPHTCGFREPKEEG